MLIFPAIDLYDGKAVRLFKGDYEKMTVYNNNPLAVARDFEAQGMKCIHIVDLEGAKTGRTPNIETIKKIAEHTGLFTEVGGGIRSIKTVLSYLEAGIDRVILGTAAVTDEEFLKEAIRRCGDKIAVGVDIKDDLIAIKGWTEKSGINAADFCTKMQSFGVGTIICTDISRDGAMRGANHSLYRMLSENFDMRIIASGGVSSIADIKALSQLGLYGAIIGKAYYTGAVSLREALEAAQ